MGHYSALGGAGTAFGPVIGGLFAQYTGWHGIFIFLSALAAFLLVSVVLFLPETKRDIVQDGTLRAPRYLRAPIRWLGVPKALQTEQSRDKVHFRIDIAAPVRLLIQPECLCIVLFTGVCYTVWQVTMVATATIYAQEYGLEERNIGLTYISNGVGSLSGSILTGKLLDREYKRQLRREQAAQQDKHQLHQEQAGKQPKEVETTELIQEVQNIEIARIKPLVVPFVAYLISVVALGWLLEYRVHIAGPITLAFFVGGLDTVILAAFCEYKPHLLILGHMKYMLSLHILQLR